MADDLFADILATPKSAPKDDNAFADILATPKGDVTPATEGAPARITVRPPGAEPKTTATEAFGRGAAGAGSFGFADELAGVAAAGGMNQQPIPQEFADNPLSMNPLALHLRTFGNILRGGANLAVGDPEAQQRRDAEIARQREQDKLAAEEHPIASTAGTLTGAVLSPVNYSIAPGAGLGARTLAAARTGAVQGGLTGLGEGEGDLNERLPGAVMGSGIGAGIGLIATPAISALGSTIRHIVSPITETVNAWRGIRNPAQDATRRVGQMIQRGAEAGDTGLSEAEFAAARAAGQPVAVLDRMGEGGRALARTAANASPEGRAILNRTIDDRFEGQGGRFAGWLNRQFNNPDAPAQQLAQRAEASLVNKPAYERAYEAGDRPIWSPKLEQLTASPDVANAVRGAVSRWRSFQVLDGYGGLNPPFNVTPDGRLVFTNSAGAPVFPNIQLWDYAARTLANKAEAARVNGVATTESKMLGGLEKQLKAELDRMVPEFGQARAGARAFFGEQNAVAAGQKFFGQGERVGLKQARIDYEKLNPEQKKLFQDGYTSRMTDVATSVRDRRSILQKFDTSDAARQEMEMVLGPRKAAETEAFLRVEEIMDRARGAIQGNSTSVRQFLEAAAFGTGTAALTGDYSLTNPYAIAAGAAGFARKRLTQSAEQKVMSEVAKLLTSGNHADYNKALQITATQPYIMNALRKATATTVGRVGGTLAGESQGP